MNENKNTIQRKDIFNSSGDLAQEMGDLRDITRSEGDVLI